MKNVIRLAVIAVIGVALVAPAFAAQGSATVGKFLVEIAKVQNLPAADGSTAAAALRARGVNLPAIDLQKSLNQGDVASIAQALGLNVTTSDPTKPFSMGEVDTFVSSFRSELGRAGGTQTPTPAWVPPPNSKGKHKGHNKTPTDPQ